LRALKYCHEKNFLHRDIKGSNILMNNKWVLKHLKIWILEQPLQKLKIEKLLQRRSEAGWFWIGARCRRQGTSVHEQSHYALVPTSRATSRRGAVSLKKSI
jgi:serine/threonine protein kinase